MIGKENIAIEIDARQSAQEKILSIVIPAYNEEKRLPAFLDQVVSWARTDGRVLEVIVVDDGSVDKTAEVVETFAVSEPMIWLLQNYQNRGKGYSIRKGMLAAQGQILVYMDADGATQPKEISENLHFIMEEGVDVFAGSRILRKTGQVLSIRRHRKWIGTVFNWITRHLLYGEVRDTQCGFKILTKNAARFLFSRSYVDGFGFDVELLYLAKLASLRVLEGPISWKEVPGSKVHLFRDSFRMFLSILQIRLWHGKRPIQAETYFPDQEHETMLQLDQSHCWLVGRIKLIQSLIHNWVKVQPRVLDAGAGVGTMLHALREKADVWGIECSQAGVRACLGRGLEKVIEGDICSMPYQSGFFDVVLCLDVLEHLAEPSQALKEIQRVLKPEGKLVVTVPAMRALYSRHDEVLGHFRRYADKDLIRDLEEAGYRVRKVGYFFAAILLPLLLKRFANRIIKKQTTSDLCDPPGKLVNAVLALVFSLEIKISELISLPFGTTVYAVAESRHQPISETQRKTAGAIVT